MTRTRARRYGQHLLAALATLLLTALWLAAFPLILAIDFVRFCLLGERHPDAICLTHDLYL